MPTYVWTLRIFHQRCQRGLRAVRCLQRTGRPDGDVFPRIAEHIECFTTDGQKNVNCWEGSVRPIGLDMVQMFFEAKLAVEQVNPKTQQVIQGDEENDRRDEPLKKRVDQEHPAKPVDHKEPRHDAKEIEGANFPGRRLMNVAVLIEMLRVWVHTYYLPPSLTRFTKSFRRC